MNKYRLIVFDWEGTLGDTLGQMLDIVLAKAEEFNLEVPDVNLTRQALIFGLNIAIKKLFPNLDAKQNITLLNAIQQQYVIDPSLEYLIPGAKDFVILIKKNHINVAIATNKSKTSLDRVLKATSMHGFFKVTRCAGEFLPKPASDMLKDIMDSFAIHKNETLMIGDSLSDIQMARSIGVDAIGINFYGQDDLKEELLNAGALGVFDNYNDLTKYLDLQAE